MPPSTEKNSSHLETRLTSDRLDANDDDDDTIDDEEHDEFGEWFHSIRSPTGLELGVRVTWPGTEEFLMQTTLPETEMAPMFHGTQWAGTRIWRAAVVGVQYMLSLPEVNERSKVLELGCGLGLPGILLHKLRLCEVVLTDRDSLLEQLNQNLDTIFSTEEDSSDSEHRQIQAMALDWSVEGVDRLLEQCGSGTCFDVVLNCDCIYEPLYGRDSWKALVACQQALLERNPDCLMITSLERRRADGVPDYLEALAACPAVAKIERIKLPEEVPEVAKEIEIYRAYGAK